MSALEQTTRGYWQVMQALRHSTPDLAFNVGRLQIMHACASPLIKSLALAELERLRMVFSRQVDGEVA